MPADVAARPYEGVRVVVFGATGFIGRWLARRLSAAGAHLALPVRAPHAARDTFASCDIAGALHELDYRHLDGVSRWLTTIRPAIVFNLAGYGVDRSETDAVQARSINTDLVDAIGTTMARAADRVWTGQQVIHAGSAMEYGSRHDDLREDGPTEPTTLYGRTKLEGTLALQRCGDRRGLRALTARLFAVYGPGERRERLLPTLMRAVPEHEAIALTAGRHERDFIYLDDVADALLRLGVVPTATPHPVNVATGTLSTVRSFVETAAHVLGIAPHRLAFGALPTRSEEMRHAPVAIDRLRSLTAWAPGTSVDEGVRRTVAFAPRLEASGAAHERERDCCWWEGGGEPCVSR